MPIVRDSSFTNATSEEASATAAWLKALILYPGRASVTTVFLQLANQAAFTPGAIAPSAPDLVIPIRGPAIGASAAAIRFVQKIIFPNAGIQFDTALRYAVTTTAGGAVVPTGNDVPTIELHFTNIL